MGQSRPLFVYFRYFLDTISIIQIEKSIDGVLGNPGPQDGRRRRNHGAMAATPTHLKLTPLALVALFNENKDRKEGSSRGRD